VFFLARFLDHAARFGHLLLLLHVETDEVSAELDAALLERQTRILPLRQQLGKLLLLGVSLPLAERFKVGQNALDCQQHALECGLDVICCVGRRPNATSDSC